MYIRNQTRGSALYKDVSCLQGVLCSSALQFTLHCKAYCEGVVLACSVVGRLNLQRPGVQQSNVCGEAAEGATGCSQEGRVPVHQEDWWVTSDTIWTYRVFIYRCLTATHTYMHTCSTYVYVSHTSRICTIMWYHTQYSVLSLIRSNFVWHFLVD